MANSSRRILYGVRSLLRHRGAPAFSHPRLRARRTVAGAARSSPSPGPPPPPWQSARDLPDSLARSDIWLMVRSYRYQPCSSPSSSEGTMYRFFSPLRHRMGNFSTDSAFHGLGKVGCSPPRAGFASSAKASAEKAQRVIGSSLVTRPLDAVASSALRYREAVGLQIEAFWKRNFPVLVGAAGLVLCVALWRIMFGIASMFVGLSESMAKYGFLALASAMVVFAGLYLRSRFNINPDKIYRIAMRKLNTSAGILEAMGAPLSGTDIRAYVMSGGRPRLKNFKLRFSGKRCFLIFPIRGSERRGLVSVEAKKKKGQYNLKLLAIDFPMATGPDQRVFLIGDETEYKVGGGLISELRDPIVKAMAAEKEFEDLDLQEEEEDEKRVLEEREGRERQKEMQDMTKEGS